MGIRYLGDLMKLLDHSPSLMKTASSPSDVISVEGLGKKYRLGVISRKMLVDQIESLVARKLGREDPHARVTESNRDILPSPYDFWALKNISFNVSQGDIVGVMGRNGSGKSTLLKILSRVTAPTEGVAKIKGRVASLLEVGTGFHPELTGRENVFLNGSILGLKQKEIAERYEKIVEFAEIAKFMDTPVKRYSSGMRVRLAFSVAAHLEPEILILDEVLAVGDAAFQEKCLEKIEATKNSGVTILFVSHSAESVKKLCTRAIVLESGRIVQAGEAIETVDAYTRSLHLHSAGEADFFTASRRSELVGHIATLLQSAKNGRVLVNAPVKTDDGIFNVDVAWVSEHRFPVIAGSSHYLSAPEICVHLHDPAADLKQFQAKVARLFKSGAAENWTCAPNGDLRIQKPLRSERSLIQNVPANILPSS